VRLSLENPPNQGELRLFNQFTQTFTVNELAERVQRVGNVLDLNVKIQYLENLRVGAEEHYYNSARKKVGFEALGLKRLIGV